MLIRFLVLDTSLYNGKASFNKFVSKQSVRRTDARKLIKHF